MNFMPASLPSVLAFVSIIVAVIVAMLGAVLHAYRTTKAVGLAALFLALWLGSLAALIASGRMAALPLSGLPFFFAPILVFGLAAGLSPAGGKIAASVPLAGLVGFQAFRLPLELVLHSWVAQGTIPPTMTWTGQNWDIISGVAALFAAPFASRSQAVVRITNIVGFALLLNVMRVALMSTSAPFGWHLPSPLQLPFHLPYALIGPVCVGGALFGHVVLTRALWRKK